MTVLLDVRAVTKRYQSVTACDEVDIEVRAGEIHGLIGENGAGKSTLVKMIYGLARPDAGTIAFAGRPLVEHHPVMARRMGISLVFQHFALFEPLTVLENIRLGLADDLDFDVLRERLDDIATRYALQIDLHRTVRSLSVSEKQRIEILRCLLQSPKLLMMDEPTSVLTPQEIENLLHLIRKIATNGCSVLFISHKLHEVKRICDRVTVMRRGKVVFAAKATDVDVETMAENMIGARLQGTKQRSRLSGRETLLKVDGLSQSAAGESEVELRNIKLEVNAGEVVGVAGIAGNGQNELLAALSGERTSAQAESIMLADRAIGHLGPAARRQVGLGFVPEDRLGHGCVPALSLVENVMLTAWERPGFSKNKLLRLDRAKALAAQVVESFDVRTPGVSNNAAQLSGGNLQKFIVGREVLQQPRLLIVAHPTWGVDAAAATAIRSALIQLAADGAGVLVVSQDLDELMEVANRIIVINNGQISKPIDNENVDAAEIGLLMAADEMPSMPGAPKHALAD